MKTIFTLLLGGLLTTSAFANNITLNFSGNRDFQVLIDGSNVNAYGSYSNTNTIYLNNLRPGQHNIEVYREKRSRGWGDGNSPVYSSTFNVSPQYDLNINIDDRGRVQIYENRSSDYGRNGDWRNRGDDRGYGRDDRGYDRNDHGYDRDNRGYERNDRRNNYSRALSDQEFNQLVNRIRSKWLGKFGAAKDAVNSNYFAVYQLRQILTIFSSENERLELAGLSYPKVVDQQNFRQLYDLFSYQGQSRLDRYIRNSRY